MISAQLIFLRRALRALSRSAVRYGSLLALVAACTFMVTGIVGSSLSVVSAVEGSAAARGVEDGRVAVTSWLPDDVERGLTRRGVELERQPSMDFEVEGDGSGSGDVLRVYPVRESIDTLAIEDGRAPASDGEVVLDRRWSEENGVGVGDEVRLGGRALTACGVGTIPDYDCCLRDVSDPHADSARSGPPSSRRGRTRGFGVPARPSPPRRCATPTVSSRRRAASPRGTRSRTRPTCATPWPTEPPPRRS